MQNKIFVYEYEPFSSHAEIDAFIQVLHQRIGEDWKQWIVTKWGKYMIWFPPDMSEEEFSKQLNEWYDHAVKHWSAWN